MRLPYEGYDHLAPDYARVFRERIEVLKYIREHPEVLPGLRAFYRDNPGQFICDWGTTFEPRRISEGLPAVLPFIPFPRQAEWFEWVMEHWKTGKPGLTEKSRDVGVSWCAIAMASTLCLFHSGMTIGFGSRKEEYVDKIGSPKSLFWKAREFIKRLPPEFRNGWNEQRDSPHMRLMFRQTGSTITGEAGDNIGRGDRASIYFVDEAAFLERPDKIEASLSATTNCRIDVSSANGLANPFAQKIAAGNVDTFRFHWRDDPRKDDAWYDKQVRELPAIVVAQEIDINYAASAEGVLIPGEWVQAAVGALAKLGLTPTGARAGALDVADTGRDFNAFALGHGVSVEDVKEWSGKESDIFATTEKAFALCDTYKLEGFRYDADGLGAGVRGDARVVNARRKAPLKQLTVLSFRGSGSVDKPKSEMVKGRKNEDFFANLKAQSWWWLRLCFQETFKAVVLKEAFDPDKIISLSPKIGMLGKLCAELSQPTYSLNSVGKIVIDKTPEGTKSPNLADAVMILRTPHAKMPLQFSPEQLDDLRRGGLTRR